MIAPFILIFTFCLSYCRNLNSSLENFLILFKDLNRPVFVYDCEAEWFLLALQ